ncbi:MAG TPA: hypothetical protein VMP01_11490 [Pirellulaceae bacterium]|nr:hypothetical protein [Pirellulaceae bacterium]
MILPLSDEMREAIHNAQRQPLELLDEQTGKRYLLVESSEVDQLWEEWVQHSLQPAFDEADRGELRPWDPDRIKAEGRKRLTGQ